MNGLTTAQAQKRLAQFGFNELPSQSSISGLKLIFSQIKNLLTFVLLAAAILSFVIGDKTDSLLIFLILSLNVGMGFWQEFKASKELETLRRLEVTITRVIRDGVQKEIVARELVPADLIVLEAGDKIPADCRLIEAFGLSVNEASLTGESAPVYKAAKENENQIFFGTVVASGRAKAEVLLTGQETRFGKIALTLGSIQEESTPLELSVNNLAKKIVILVIAVAILLFVVRTLQGFDQVEAFFTSIALMVAAVPEGLPAVISIVLAIGVHRMYKRKALVRKMSAVESLGAATVICTDKTGTLTKNQMRVKTVLASDQNLSLLTKTAIFCNSSSLVMKENHGSMGILGDTTEGALLLWAHDKNIDIDLMRSEGELIEEKPFNLITRLMSVVWRENDQDSIYVKGAPEAVLANCRLSKSAFEQITKEYQKLASDGLRVLAFACKKNFDQLQDLDYLGLIGIADEARPEAKIAIAKAFRAGIKVVMITGDNELTAKAIAEEVGLIKEGDEILTGVQLDELDDEELSARLEKVRIFARVIPEHKLRIVEAFQRLGHVVAVTGDGINDSLALKQSHIGVAMGQTGTDVAKEAADIIILDDNFSTIVSAIEQGRLIYNNLLKIIRFLLAGNLSEILLIVAVSLLGLPSPLFPVQILWINFVTDGLPALSLAFDPASNKLMSNPPRRSNNLLNLQNSKFILLSGLSIGIITTLVFVLFLHQAGLVQARAMTFSAMVFLQMGLIFLMRKNYPFFANKYLLVAVGLILFLQLLINFVPELRFLFKLDQLMI